MIQARPRCRPHPKQTATVAIKLGTPMPMPTPKAILSDNAKPELPLFVPPTEPEPEPELPGLQIAVCVYSLFAVG